VEVVVNAICNVCFQNFAPEGFIDKKYEPLLKKDNVRVIEVRYLADGLVFHTIQHHTMHP
jgi:hypothetical protein